VAHVAVVGAGVIGATSAWVLARAGHRVTLIDRHPGPAQGASRANGAQLSYAYGDALANPAMLRKLPAIALGLDPAFRVRLQTNPEFLLWGLRFVRESLPGRFLSNTRELLQMAARTRVLLAELMTEFELPFDHSPSGKMILYGSAAACDAGRAVRELKQQLGIRQEVLSRDEATAIEPALASYPDVIERVVWSEADAAGRPDAFCAALVRALERRYGLVTRFGATVQAIEHERGQVAGLRLAGGEALAFDTVVLATGSATQLLPRRDRPRGGLWPVQGYSITAPATAGAMRVSITDLRRKIVFARLGRDVRAAGLADIGRYDIRFDKRRFESFRAHAVQAFGAAFVHAPGTDLQPWTGGRPCTPSSRPIVRAGSLQGLYLNLGHGTLGWTLGLGSAERLMAVMGTRV
jgi:D-amino-acid dehydrogenase